MNYYEKYTKYKKKYIDLKKFYDNEKGGNGDKPILQTFFTSIDEYAKCQFNDKSKINTLITNIKKNILPASNASMIQVRGDGNCMLYAVSAYLFLYLNGINLRIVRDILTDSVNKCDVRDFIKQDNQLNSDITGYDNSNKILIRDNFSEISDIIIGKKSSEYGMEISETKQALEFVNEFSDTVPIYPFAQLGKVISTVLNCVIVNISDSSGNYEFYGLYPNGESIEKDVFPDELIIENIKQGEWKVVFIFNPSQRHFYSLIPEFGPDSKDIPIKDLSIRYFEQIIGRVQWI